jgi:hypothetical protein
MRIKLVVLCLVLSMSSLLSAQCAGAATFRLTVCPCNGNYAEASGCRGAGASCDQVFPGLFCGSDDTGTCYVGQTTSCSGALKKKRSASIT